MDQFRTGKKSVHTYPDPPHNYYREEPTWEWKEDLRETASPELGEKAVNAMVDHLVSLLRSELRKIPGES
jgi:hypothetical protein